MRITKLEIKNFRGIKNGEIYFPDHGVLVGDNNTGKSTILEAIDLVLGPDRLNRRTIINEHDFYAGDYINTEGNPIEIEILATIAGLTEEQERHFKDHIEFWDNKENQIISEPVAEKIDQGHIESSLRVGFSGRYDKEDDDFSGETYFLSPTKDDGTKIRFKKMDKRICGFLYLRTIRTGSRALSLERGSLLDIILQLKEIRLNMWEETLEKIRPITVAENPELGVSNILSSVQDAIRKLVPSDWGENPQMKISDLTRDHLRKTLTVFMNTGAKQLNGEGHIAPFKYQGTGTVNTLILSMLSLIAELKQNVIFAMEEPEIAIPPHTQKRVINSVIGKSSQSIFTSHSPYVLEEFDPSQIMTLKNENGNLSSKVASFPKMIKRKAYQAEFRKKYCEALLAKRVLIAEGRTEYDAIPVAAKRLNELSPSEYSSLEELGIAIVDAESDSKIAPIAKNLKELGKTTYAIYDLQEGEQKTLISGIVDFSYESTEASFEKLILNNVPEVRLRAFIQLLIEIEEWPNHIDIPAEGSNLTALKEQLSKYFKWSKGAGTAAELIAMCELEEIPQFIRDTLKAIKRTVSNENQDATDTLKEETEN